MKVKNEISVLEIISWIFIWLITGLYLLCFSASIYSLRSAASAPHPGFELNRWDMDMHRGIQGLANSVNQDAVNASEGGRITEINGIPVRSKKEVAAAMRGLKLSPGDEAVFSIERKDHTVDRVKVVLTRMTRGDMAQNIYWVVFAFVFFLCGALVMFLKPHTRTSWALFLLSAGCGINYGCLPIFYSYSSFVFSSGFWYSFFGALFLFGCIFMRLQLFVIAAVFPEELSVLKKRPRLFWGAVLMLAAYAVFHIIFSGGVDIYYPGIIAVLSLISKPLYLFRLIHVIRRGLTPIAQIRARTVFLGFCIAMISAVSTVIDKMVLPGALKLPAGISVYIDGFMLAAPLIMAYAIIRHNMFETPLLIRRTVFYLFTMSFLVAGYALFIGAAQKFLSALPYYGEGLYNVFYILIVFYVFLAVKNFFQFMVDRVFYRSKIDFARVESEAAGKLSVIRSIREAEKYLEEVIVNNLFVEDARFLTKSGKEYKDLSGQYILKDDHALAKAVLHKKGILSHSELEENPVYRKRKFECLSEMARLECAFIMPILFKKELKGILTLGQRKSGELVFNMDDIRLLKRIAAEAAVMLENMDLYLETENAKKEVENLNEILEEKVKIRTAELEARAKELEEQNAHIVFITHNKSAFLASMSHELRTPLNGIIGFADMAVEGVYGQINPVAKDVLKDLAFNGREVLQLINDILDLSKIEAGKMELKMEDFSPRDAVDIAMGGWMNECEKKGIKVETEFAPDLPLGWGEEKRVKQVLDTLLRNAVRWSQTKRITMRVTCAPEHQSTSAPEKKVLLFEVEDYGVGIEAYRMPKLFVEHEYPQILNLSYYKNVGLGLALAKKWAELHGGTMRAESAERKGSKFSFTIPLKA